MHDSRASITDGKQLPLSGWTLTITEGVEVRDRINFNTRHIIIRADRPAADVARKLWAMVQRIQYLEAEGGAA